MGIESPRQTSQEQQKREFTGADKAELMKLIVSRHSRDAADRLKEFTSVSSEVAFELIDAGKGYMVAENIESFDPSFHHMIVDEMLEKNREHWASIKLNISKFNIDEDRKRVVQELSDIFRQKKIAGMETVERRI